LSGLVALTGLPEAARVLVACGRLQPRHALEERPQLRQCNPDRFRLFFLFGLGGTRLYLSEKRKTEGSASIFLRIVDGVRQPLGKRLGMALQHAGVRPALQQRVRDGEVAQEAVTPLGAGGGPMAG